MKALRILTPLSVLHLAFGNDITCDQTYEYNKYCEYPADDYANPGFMLASHYALYVENVAERTRDEVLIGFDPASQDKYLDDDYVVQLCNAFNGRKSNAFISEWQVVDVRLWNPISEFGSPDRYLCGPDEEGVNDDGNVFDGGGFLEQLLRGALFYDEDYSQLEANLDAADDCTGGSNCPALLPADDPSYDLSALSIANPDDLKLLCPFKYYRKCILDWRTFDPTNAPSGSPTQTPTNSPTNPTNSPTAAPSSPTNSPTNSPSNSPTDAPTDVPSFSPTDAPSNAPTKAPTGAPSVSPTNAPSDSPTETPTNAPSDSPTEAPTDVPSDSPTQAPSVSPSDAPSNAPTGTPTDAPSDSPTKAPSNAPTETPTNAPSDSPTDAPSNAPTDTPTNAPSDSPTKAPSNAPTATPTDAPSGSPTDAPSGSPTKAPSSAPTDIPTAAPTDNPTGSPTASPTTPSPTGQPTRAPVVVTHPKDSFLAATCTDAIYSRNSDHSMSISLTANDAALVLLSNVYSSGIQTWDLTINPAPTEFLFGLHSGDWTQSAEPALVSGSAILSEYCQTVDKDQLINNNWFDGYLVRFDASLNGLLKNNYGVYGAVYVSDGGSWDSIPQCTHSESSDPLNVQIIADFDAGTLSWNIAGSSCADYTIVPLTHNFRMVLGMFEDKNPVHPTTITIN